MSININELSEGGRGIKLLSQLADELSYTHTATRQNCLVIRKTYEENLSPQPAMKKGKALERLLEFFYRWNWLNESDREKNSEPPIKRIRLRVKSELSALTEVLNWYERLKHLPIPKSEWWKCQLALAEGFTNAVRHAHRGMPLETPIELEIMVFKGLLEIRIWDSGQPFDFDAKLREIRAIDQLTYLDYEGIDGES
ncbi:MAG TPA: ATP-binding protein [Kamptonema sp.]|nr:ATP-binding protein [Kamptonema sp.]